MDIERLLTTVIEHQASDLHLQVGSAPMLRIHGQLAPVTMDELSSEDIDQAFDRIADDEHKQRLNEDRAVDFAYVFGQEARFRVNVFHDRDQLSIAMRQIPNSILSFEQLKLPPVMQEIAAVERGLVLVTGTTGSGKSTTLAAMIDWRNRNLRNRIITIEDPIEFVHTSNKSLVAQREIGRDARAFLPAVRDALRQDPDVILVGELRDADTMRTAIQAADTGHAVFSTVHSSRAAQTVKRLIAMFPAQERELLMMQLASNLEAVVSQRLARTLEGDGRVPVVEILRDSPVVRKLLEEGRVDSLPQAMANGENGMQLFDQHLGQLYTDKVIKGREALRLADNPEAVSMAMRGMSTRDTSAGLVR